MPTASADGSPNRLARDALTWPKSAAIGISIAVAGCYAGWNYGLGIGGWGGMLVAALGTAALFACLTQATAELAASMPHHAGFDHYVRFALGPVPGFIAGVSVALGLAVATGLALTFTAAYTEGMLGIGGWPVKLTLLVAVLVLHMRGARDAVGTTMVVGAFAVAVLIAFLLMLAPAFDPDNLTTKQAGGATFFPNGLLGIANAVPFALFMLLGVEQSAQSAAEVRDPGRAVPKALVVAMSVSVVLGLLVLGIATGAAGADALATVDDPMIASMQIAAPEYARGWAMQVIGAGALVSFLAAFFSVAYGASRQLHHLAASGALPHWLARTNSRGAPVSALLLVGAIGLFTTTLAPDSVMVIFIFLMLVTYQLMLLAFIRLRHTHPTLARPYRALGGRACGWIGAVLGLAAALCCYQLEVSALSYAVGVIGLLTVYFVRARRLHPIVEPAQ